MKKFPFLKTAGQQTIAALSFCAAIVLLQYSCTSAKEESAELFNQVQTQLEKPADFPGGANAWRRYLETNLRYPEKAQQNGTQGKVTVEFVVNEDGTLNNIKALNNPGDSLAEVAVGLITKGPKWEPAEHDGKKVSALTTKTITFRLE